MCGNMVYWIGIVNRDLQVHGARLRGSQEDVVIKVLKPGIEDVLVADLNFVYVVARILDFLNPEFQCISCMLLKKLELQRGTQNGIEGAIFYVFS